MGKFEPVTKIVDGYFYTFNYTALKDDPKYDKMPFILCLGPHPKSLNCFLGINLHRVPLEVRVKFLLFLNQHFDMQNGDERIADFITMDGLKNTFPEVRAAIRSYNRKGVRNSYRIKGCDVGRYIEYDGDFMMKEPSDIMNEYWNGYSETVKAEGRGEL